MHLIEHDGKKYGICFRTERISWVETDKLNQDGQSTVCGILDEDMNTLATGRAICAPNDRTGASLALTRALDMLTRKALAGLKGMQLYSARQQAYWLADTLQRAFNMAWPLEVKKIVHTVVATKPLIDWNSYSVDILTTASREEQELLAQIMQTGQIFDSGRAAGAILGIRALQADMARKNAERTKESENSSVWPKWYGPKPKGYPVNDGEETGPNPPTAGFWNLDALGSR